MLSDLSWGTAIVGSIQCAIGMGFGALGQYFSRRVRWPAARALLSWPCYGLSFIFMLGAAVTILWNMFGPLILWILRFVKNI